MPEQIIPDSRAYRHLKCDEETVVSEEPFEGLSNPMSGIDKTMCSICGAMFPVTEFEWSDTGEKISDYYARHSKDATDKQRFLCSRKFMILFMIPFILLGVGGCYLLAKDQVFLAQACCMFAGLAIGAVVGGNIYLKVIEGPITKKVCGVSDTRVLK